MSDCILIVDDDPLVMEALTQVFADDYDVLAAPSGFQALEILDVNKDIHAVVLDIRMAKMDGLETARKIHERDGELPIIFHTGYPGDYSEGEIEKEYQPFDYIIKNERPARLRRAAKNAVIHHKLHTDVGTIRQIALEDYGLVGKSEGMLKVYRLIKQVAQSDSKILILGPTGSGKELVAKAIHKTSRRGSAHLGILNCNHKAPDLIESQLFGHLKGSFTGAIADTIGLFEYANGGTVFLDEIGDLDITTQAKILRIIEYGEFHKVGSPEIQKTDIRLICATHRDLQQMVADEIFREDLFYRINGITITLPPLKDRREDIPLLIDYFSENYFNRNGCVPKIFESDALDYMIAFDWPGNVRQLLDTVQSLYDLTPSSYITCEDVMKYLKRHPTMEPNGQSLSDKIKNYKKTVIIQALARNDYNVSATARELLVDPANLHKMINELNIIKG